MFPTHLEFTSFETNCTARGHPLTPQLSARYGNRSPPFYCASVVPIRNPQGWRPMLRAKELFLAATPKGERGSGFMARVILPLDPRDREQLEQLSHEIGLAVAVLLDLWRRGYEVKRLEENQDEW